MATVNSVDNKRDINGVLEYRVLWSDGKKTWVAVDTLKCEELIQQFENQFKKNYHEVRPYKYNLIPLRILSGAYLKRKYIFQMEFLATDKVLPIELDDAIRLCPDLVIRFLANRISWEEDESDKDQNENANENIDN